MAKGLSVIALISVTIAVFSSMLFPPDTRYAYNMENLSTLDAVATGDTPEDQELKFKMLNVYQEKNNPLVEKAFFKTEYVP